MDEETFQRNMMAATVLPGDYSEGYRLGLSRCYHGKKFGSDATHELYMNLSGHHQEMGDGYRDGFSGKSFILAIKERADREKK